MMEELKPVPMTLRIAMQISACHFLMNVRFTGYCMTFLVVWGLVVIKLVGPPLPDGMLLLGVQVSHFVREHLLWFAIPYAVIFALPANLGCMMVLVKYQFSNYRVYPVYHQPVHRHLYLGERFHRSEGADLWILSFVRKMQMGCDELFAFWKNKIRPD